MDRSSSEIGHKASGDLSVVLVDPLHVVRTGLSLLISGAPRMSVVAQAGDADEATAVIEGLKVKRGVIVVVGMDLDGDRDAFWLIRHLRETQPTLRILACGARSAQGIVSRALFMGADGFADQCTDPEEFIAAIEACGRGTTVITGECRNRLASIITEIGNHRENGQLLSDREIEVLRAASTGATARDMSERLGLAERTVTTHLSRIYAKLGVTSRIAAVSKARAEGLIPSLAEVS